MKKMILTGLLASSMLAAVPLRAAEVNWIDPADEGTNTYNWSTPGYWQGGVLPQAGNDVGFQLSPPDQYSETPFSTTVIYDVPPSPGGFNFVGVVDTAFVRPFTLRIDAPNTFSANEVMVFAFGTLALHGGTVITDYESTVGVTIADGVVSAGVILQTAGINTIRQILDISTGAYNLVGGVLSATRELIESAGEFFQSGGTNTVGSTLVVDGTYTQDGGDTYTDVLTVGEGGVGTYSLGGGSLDAGIENVGNSSAGVFTQSGGTNTAGTLSIGSQAFGTYTLSGGTLDAFGMEINNGVFNQSGGINNLTTAMIGMSDGFTGRFDLSGGALSADAVFVGNRGPGNFLHTGGTSNVNELTIGANGASGTYTLNGLDGTGATTSLTAGVEHIGYSGTGVFNQLSNIDGVHTVGELYLGYNAGANGSYNMSGHALLAAGDMVVGRAGNGTFTQNRGSNLIGAVAIGGVPTGTGTLTIGDLLGGTGVYSMNPIDSALPELWASTEVIGNYGTGTFRQFGGTNTVAGDLYLGRYDTGVGNYTLSGFPDTYFNPFGTSPPPTVLLAANEYIGSGGTGTFNQTGGTNRLSGDLHVGGSGTGTYDLSGGTLYTANIWIGAGTGTGTFIQRGGTNNVSNVLTVGANGTYTLSGIEGPGSPASLITGGILNNGTFNYSGGFLSIFRPPIGPPPYPPDPDFTNNGTLNISGTGEWYFSSPVINNGTVKTTETTVTFNGDFINNGAYISDPSTNIFSNLTVGETGYLVGALGDVFRMNGNLIVRSLRNDDWNTSGASLEFSSGIHTLDASGSTVDFRFATLRIDSGGYFSGSSHGTISADVLNIYDFLSFLTGSLGNGIRINYGSLFAFGADGSSLDLTEAELNRFASLGFIQASGTQAPVPEPSTMLLLGSGLAGLAGYGGRRFKRN